MKPCSVWDKFLATNYKGTMRRHLNPRMTLNSKKLEAIFLPTV